MSMVNRSQSSRFSLQSLCQEAAGQKVKKNIWNQAYKG